MPGWNFTADCGLDKTFEGISRNEADKKVKTHVEFCADCDDTNDVTISRVAQTDGGTATVTPDVVDHSPESGDDDEDETEVVEATTEQLPDNPNVNEDPLDWVPGHFVDTIQGKPAINRKGYAVLASNYDVSVTAEPVVLPHETDFEYAQFRAVATTADGQEYSGFGSAHVDRGDGDNTDNKLLLAELAETRAMKRAAAWATGVGMTAVEELKGDVQ